MRRIDIDRLNQNLCYQVTAISDEDYHFRTEHNVDLVVSFVEDFSIWETGAYQFVITNANNTKSPNDPKIKETVFALIEAFFDENPDILLYVCETGDGKESLRDRLFLRWLKDYSQKGLFYVEHVEMTVEGIDNYAVLIVERRNPCLYAIISEFHEAMDELRKPGVDYSSVAL